MNRTLRVLAVATVAALATVAPPVAASAQADGQWWHAQWEMDQVWSIGDGDGVTVAVLDTGVDASVPELAGSVIPGTDFTGLAGDGTTDIDPDSHGTAMAALITGNGREYVGVAPGATVLPVVVSGVESPFDEAVDWYARGIRYAVDNSAQVVNISSGAPPFPSASDGDGCPRPIADAVRYAAASDVIVVAASGNAAGGESEFPGRCAGVLTVGANDAQLRPWDKSHRSEFVEVSAPGVNVTALGSDGWIGTGSGTSAATALVSGAIALVRAEFPDDSADDILRRIIHTAGDIHTEGWDDATGYGVVQPYYALTEPLPPDAPNPVYDGLEQAGSEPTQGALPGASPLVPGAGASDSGALATPVLLAAIGIGLLIVLVVVITVVVVASGKHRRPQAAHPPPQYPPPPYQGPPPRPR